MITRSESSAPFANTNSAGRTRKCRARRRRATSYSGYIETCSAVMRANARNTAGEHPMVFSL